MEHFEYPRHNRVSFEVQHGCGMFNKMNTLLSFLLKRQCRPLDSRGHEEFCWKAEVAVDAS